MAGRYIGAAKLFQYEYPQAIYINCASNHLNCIVDCSMTAEGVVMRWGQNNNLGSGGGNCMLEKYDVCVIRLRRFCSCYCSVF